MPHAPLHRRRFLHRSGLFLSAVSLSSATVSAQQAGPPSEPLLRVGLVTDLHYAERPPGGTRYYRETPTKLAEACRKFAHAKIDLAVELGDLVDTADSREAEIAHARRIAAALAQASPRACFVLGNHCVGELTKAEFLQAVGQKESYFSFNCKGVHLVVLDACFRADGEPYGRHNFQWTDANLPPAELEWLRADLAATDAPALVFVHQRLDVEPPYGLGNAAEVRKVLENSGKVCAVLQGHEHKGDYRKLGGVHYVTLAAMVEGSGPDQNAYALLDVLPGGGIRLTGFRRQKSYGWGG